MTITLVKSKETLKYSTDGAFELHPVGACPSNSDIIVTSEQSRAGKVATGVMQNTVQYDYIPLQRSPIYPLLMITQKLMRCQMVRYDFITLLSHRVLPAVPVLFCNRHGARYYRFQNGQRLELDVRHIA